MSRPKINISGSTMDLLTTMSEGNPGAITVLMKMIEAGEENLILILGLDDMNIRGSQIWVGYKDYCEENIETFLACVRDREQGMVDQINEECYRPDLDYEGYDQKAVTSGASW